MRCVLITVIFLILFSLPAAAEINVHITADELNYYQEGEEALARGNVVVTWDNNRLTCDELYINFPEEYLEARGNVYLRQESSGFRSDELKYYFEEEKVIILEARGETESEEVEGTVFIHSGKIEADPEVIDLEEARVTTCDLDEPHYFLRSSRVEIYPGDKLVARHVSFWEFSGRVPLLYWPYLVISLEDRDQRIAPEIGYSGRRGWFVRTSYNYYLENTYGKILADFYSLTGLGFGVRHFYMDSPDGDGEAYLYVQQDQVPIGLPLLEGSWRHTQDDILGGDFDSRFAFDYYPDDRINLRGHLDWRATGEKWNLRLDNDMSGIWDLDPQAENAWPTRDASLFARFDYEPTPGHSLRFEGEYDTEWEEDEEIFEERWAGLARYRGGDAGLRYDVFLERDAPSLGDSGDYFHTIPEVKLTVRPSHLETPSWMNPFSLEIMGGYYEDGEEALRAGRGGGKIDFNRYFRPFNWLNVNFNQQVEGYGYSTGDFYGEYYGRTRLTLRPLTWLNSSLTYTYRQPFGESPFGWDRSTVREDIRADLRLSSGPWNASFRSGYVLHRRTFNDVTGQVRYRTGNLNLRAATGYSIENQRWRDVVLTGQFDLDRIELSAGYRFNPDPFHSKKIEGQVGWQATDSVQLEGLLVYDVEDAELDRGAARMVWDLHCRELVFSYDHVRTEFMVQYQILAFPGQSVEVISTPDDMLFDLEMGDLFDDLW